MSWVPVACLYAHPSPLSLSAPPLPPPSRAHHLHILRVLLCPALPTPNPTVQVNENDTVFAQGLEAAEELYQRELAEAKSASASVGDGGPAQAAQAGTTARQHRTRSPRAVDALAATMTPDPRTNLITDGTVAALLRQVPDPVQAATRPPADTTATVAAMLAQAGHVARVKGFGVAVPGGPLGAGAASGPAPPVTIDPISATVRHLVASQGRMKALLESGRDVTGTAKVSGAVGGCGGTMEGCWGTMEGCWGTVEGCWGTMEGCWGTGEGCGGWLPAGGGRVRLVEGKGASVPMSGQSAAGLWGQGV